ASSSPRRFSATNPASARSLISVAEVLDTAAERLTAASAIAAMASATSTSISVNPREADPPNDVSVDDELLARARHRRGELAAQAVRRDHHPLAGREVATVDAHARELGAPGERAAAVKAAPRIQDPVPVLAALPEGVALRYRGPGDAAAARARLAHRRLEERCQPSRLGARGLRVAGKAHHDDGRRDHRHDGEHDQDFDQRETGLAPYRVHEPMSASKPSPPAAPSAPKLNTSIPPWRPGLRYW